MSQNETVISHPLAARIQAALDDHAITLNVPIEVATLIHASRDLDSTSGMALARTLGLDSAHLTQAQDSTTLWIKGTAADGSTVVIFLSAQPSSDPAIGTATEELAGSPDTPAGSNSLTTTGLADRIQAALDDLSITPHVVCHAEIHAWDLDPARGMTLAQTLALDGAHLKHRGGNRWITGTAPDGNEVTIHISDQPETDQPQADEAHSDETACPRAGDPTHQGVARIPRWAADVLAQAVVDAGHYPCREHDDGTGDELCGSCSDASEGVTGWPCPVAQQLTPDLQNLIRAITADNTSTPDTPAEEVR